MNRMDEVSSFLALVKTSAQLTSVNMGYLSVTFITSLIVYLTYYNIALVEAKDNSAPTVNACCTLPIKASVKPAIAETTTTGRSSCRSNTMPAAFLKADAPSTDVPPNFMIVGFIQSRTNLTAKTPGRKGKTGDINRFHCTTRLGPSLILLVILAP